MILVIEEISKLAQKLMKEKRREYLRNRYKGMKKKPRCVPKRKCEYKYQMRTRIVTTILRKCDGSEKKVSKVARTRIYLK